MKYDIHDFTCYRPAVTSSSLKPPLPTGTHCQATSKTTGAYWSKRAKDTSSRLSWQTAGLTVAIESSFV